VVDGEVGARDGTIEGLDEIVGQARERARGLGL
jgi:hypothetical protein